MSGFLGGGIGPVAFGGGGAADTPWYLAGGAPMPVAAYQPIGAASLSASYVNLANPGVYDAAPGVAPTLGAGGWGFDGIAQYLRVQIGLATTAMSIVLRYAGAISGFSAAVGSSANGAARIAIIPRYAGDAGKRAYRHGGTAVSGVGADAAGIMALCGNIGYFNGFPEAGPFTVSVGTGYIGIGAYYDPVGYWTGTIASVAIYDTSANHAIWMPAVSAAMAAL